MRGITKDEFIRDYSKKLMDRNAALFIGAGLSRPAGFVDWKELLQEITQDLRLEIDKEYDLISIAQYHLNERKTRDKLNAKLIEEFTRDARLTQNHALIARLPIHTVWTTNYDKLLEEAFKAEHKRVDAKITAKNIAQAKRGIDVTVYKLHGDVSLPHEAILTKDDYETFNLSRELFTIRLKGDLVSLSFLFLGFSFTDPNIEYILSRIKNLLGKDTPTHYCVIKRPTPPTSPSPQDKADYEYEYRKLDLRIGDLQRFGIQTVLIDDYQEVTGILQELNRRARMKNIFVSGSAIEGSPDFDYTRLLGFSRKLGKEIISRGYNLVSGFGVGIGSEVIIGAVEDAYLTSSSMHDRLILRPFPQTPQGAERDRIFREWRERMLSLSGFSIFIAGNKIEGRRKKTVIGQGVLDEFKIGVSPPLHNFPIPIGVTGYAARQIWDEVMNEPARFFDAKDVSGFLETLGDSTCSDEDLLNAIFKIIKQVHS